MLRLHAQGHVFASLTVKMMAWTQILTDFVGQDGLWEPVPRRKSGSAGHCSDAKLEGSRGRMMGERQTPAGTAKDQMELSPPLMPQWSKYTGEEIDVSSRRSIERVNLGSDESAIVDHFLHKGRFYRAVIPMEGVESVYGQTFNFSEKRTRVTASGREVIFDRRGLPKRKIPIAFHVQTRFSMKAEHPIRLYALGTEAEGEALHEVREWVYTVEANGPVGWEFSLSNGLSGNLLSVHRFLSMEEMVFERIVVENQYVTESPSLPLTEAQKRELLQRSIARSHRAGMSERYFLFRVCGTNNCTSNPFKILDEVLVYRGWHRLGAMFFRLPIAPRLYLRMRGLDSDPACFKLVRDEYQNFVEQSETQQRKRKYVRALIKRRREVSQ